MQPVKKRMIKTKVQVHDRTQLEAIVDFYVRGKRHGVITSEVNYQVDFFFILPSTLGIDKQNYPKEAFYQDIRPIIRFREPRYKWKHFTQTDHNSIVTAIEEKITMLEQGQPLSVSVDEVIKEYKVAICSFTSLLARKSRKLRQTLRTGNVETDELVSRTATEIDRIGIVFGRFESLHLRICALQSGFCTSLKQVSRTNLEYMFYRYRDTLFEYLKQIQKSETDTRKSLHASEQELLACIKGLDAIASKHEFMLVTAESSDEELERYTTRRGAIKRRTWSPMFLHARDENLFKFQRQAGAMIAAGLAAFWAVIGQIILVRKLALSENMSEFWGIGGLMFATGAVLFYIVKDRIKEIGRNYISSGFLFRSLPDSRESIQFKDAEGQYRQIGTLQESVRFLDQDRWPSYVRDLREKVNEDHAEVSDQLEQAIHYVKNVTISNESLEKAGFPFTAVHDIIRVNFERWLGRLDDPWYTSNYLTNQNSVEEFVLPKRYFLDVIIRKRTRIGNTVNSSGDLEYLRIGLNKKGLLNYKQLHTS